MAEKRKMRRASTRTRWAKRWVESGLTQREFAERHGLTAGSLSRWIRELRDGEAEEAVPGEFVEVPTGVAVGCGVVRLRVGAVTVEFDQLPPADYVVALGRAAC